MQYIGNVMLYMTLKIVYAIRIDNDFDFPLFF